MKKIFELFSLFAILIVLAGCVSAYLTPLQNAAYKGDINAVKALLDKGADVNEWNYGTALIMAASEKENTDVVKLLIDRGADINAMSQGGTTALGTAAEFAPQSDIVKILIERGADTDKAITGLEQRAAFLAKPPAVPDQVLKVQNGINLIKKIQSTLPNRDGLAYYSKGQYQNAINSFKTAISSNPSNSDNFIFLSSSYIELKQYDEAITAAKRAIELKPDNDSAYSNLGYAYGMKKQYDEAIKAFKKSIEINPKDENAYGWMGSFLRKQNAYNEAVEAYKKAVELQPANINYLIGLATTYRLMGRYDDAIASVNKAIELQSYTGIGINDAIESGYPVVKNVMEAGPAKKADILAGDKIIKIDGKSTKGWNPEQVVQSLRGTSGTQVVLTIERKGAEKTIDKTVTRETIITKEAALSFGLRSLAYRYKGILEAALKDAEKAYSLDSANGWAQLSLGASYLDKGKYEEAIKLLAQVKDSLTARILEATAYAKQGKTKEAVDVYFSIPEEEISAKNIIPLINNRMALLQTFKPFVKEHRDKARSFESKGQYKEALSELSEALKTADDTEAQEIQENIFGMIRKNPLLAEVPEDARKYALRSEMLVKEGNFEQAATELKKAIQIAPYAARLYYNSALINAELKKYPEAIRHMKIYLKAAPDAPDARDAKDGIIKWEFMMEKGKTF